MAWRNRVRSAAFNSIFIPHDEPSPPAMQNTSLTYLAAKTGKPKRPFPGVTLEEALKVPHVIRQKNNGHPWDTGLVATACGTSRANKNFFYLAAAARDYNLTIGSRDTAQISLAELGRALLYAPSPEIERGKKTEAFLSVEKFK